jgi:hypothetical protein
MPWTTPTVRNAGDAILASDQNIWVNDLIDLRAVLANTKQTHKTDTWGAAANASYQDVTGMSVSITPTSATSKIEITVVLHASTTFTGASLFNARVWRGSSATPLAFVAAGTQPSGNTTWTVLHLVFVDSPATTSATTYQVQMSNSNGATNTAYVNIRGDATTTATSSITAREIPV